MGAFASLLITDARSHGSYRLRFSSLVSKMLDGVDYVYLHKDEKRGFILVTPIREKWREDDPSAFHLHTNGNAKYISMNRLLLHEGFLRKEMFGKRYKVKYDRYGRLYIFLNEVVK